MSYRKDSVEILYKNLPSIYREKDKDQNHDLYHYLSGLGLVLDKTRHTLEQKYADSFPDGGENEAHCQDWLVPYFADLFAVELRSPTRHGKRNEVSNAVRWAQRKGTLGTAEEIIEAISLTEGVVQEGWQRVATTARIGIPVPDARSMGDAQPLFPDAGTTAPSRAADIASHPSMPNVTPNVHYHSRAVETDPYNPAAQSWSGNHSLRVWPSDDNDPYVIEDTDPDQIYWRQIHPHGVPCFVKGTAWGDTYQDVSVRTPDTRTPKNAVGEVIGGFHPKRLIAFLPSPEGICVGQSFTFKSSELTRDILVPFMDAKTLEDAKPLEQRLRISEIIEALELDHLREIDETAPLEIRNFVSLNIDTDGAVVVRNVTSHSVRIEDPFSLTDDIDIRFEKMRFTDTFFQDAGKAYFYRCAINRFSSSINDGPLSIRSYFMDCLIENLSSESATVQCEYVTVRNSLKSKRLLASDCIFAMNEDAIEPGADSCVRYSRIAIESISSANRNTSVKVKWAVIDTDFCQSGCAVLSSDCSDEIRFGAEDGGEMGVHHSWYLAAQDEALTQKLNQYLPIGIEPVIVRDRTLNCRPRPIKRPPTE